MKNFPDQRSPNSPGRIVSGRRALWVLAASLFFFVACNRSAPPTETQKILEQFKSPDAQSRLAAVDFIRAGAIVPPEFLAPLSELLQDPDSSVRTMSALALRCVEKDCEKVLPPLARAFESETDARVKTAMFEALDALTKRHQDEIEGRIRRTAERE